MNTNTHTEASELTQLGLSVKDVAKLLGVSARHVWSLHSSGRIPAPIKLGKATRWNRVEIEQWLAAGAPSRERWDSMKDATR